MKNIVVLLVLCIALALTGCSVQDAETDVVIEAVQ